MSHTALIETPPQSQTTRIAGPITLIPMFSCRYLCTRRDRS